MYSRTLNFTVALVLCISLLVGCDDNNDSSEKAANQFTYSVLTSTRGSGVDLLEELDNSVLPKLRKAGADVYATWSGASESNDSFQEIAEDKLVVMLRWKKVKTTLLSKVLGEMTGVSDVTTSLWEASLRGDEDPIQTGSGFYIVRFNRYLSEDIDQVLSLTEQAWVTWEPFWGGIVPGVWRDLDEVDKSNGITRLMRIAWYRDLDHWLETRQAWKEPESFELFIQRAALELDDEGWSAQLQQR